MPFSRSLKVMLSSAGFWHYPTVLYNTISFQQIFNISQ